MLAVYFIYQVMVLQPLDGLADSTGVCHADSPQEFRAEDSRIGTCRKFLKNPKLQRRQNRDRLLKPLSFAHKCGELADECRMPYREKEREASPFAFFGLNTG